MTFAEARHCILTRVAASRVPPPIETVRLDAAAGRILAAAVRADRDYPPLARSVRDGFAVRAQDVPGKLHVAGEVRAGGQYAGSLLPGEAIEIMTGAPLPSGADAVVMVEHTTRDGGRVSTDRSARRGDFINPRGAEARAGAVLLEPGRRLDYSGVALLATVGVTEASVYARPKVAILATGDEIVEPDQTPKDFQIRNSNVWSLAAQVSRAGGLPGILPIAPDELAATRALLARGLEADLLLISGGVSAGKYDLVEQALAELGAEFFFDRVKIQPGQPLVFGSARGKFFFGLPGNPASTMVTFEVFARAAVELLGGVCDPMLPCTLAALTKDFRHKTGLTRFLPASLSPDGVHLTPVPWQGSGDLPALTKANAYLVADADREEWKAGDLMRVLLK